MPDYLTPGVYKEDILPPPRAAFRTGVPVFLGYAAGVSPNTPRPLTLWSQFAQSFGTALSAGGPFVPRSDGYLADAVRGFFANGGTLCYVVRLDENRDGIEALEAGLEAVAALDTIDLVCAPDIMAPREQSLTLNPLAIQAMQNLVLHLCDSTGDRFAILDALPVDDNVRVIRQRQGLHGTNGALYFPWLLASVGTRIPPCGHIAGIYARTDNRTGVHKAPANETVEGVLDVDVVVTGADQAQLNPLGINCTRAFRGRGLRVWGARTLSQDPNWTYVNVRRLFLTAGRWVERTLGAVAFEPNDPRLWTRITRELTSYFTQLFAAGALQGQTAADAFFVKCDMETNPADVREAGRVVTEIGLAPSRPNEFIIVRIIHDASGVSITGPTPPS